MLFFIKRKLTYNHSIQCMLNSMMGHSKHFLKQNHKNDTHDSDFIEIDTVLTPYTDYENF